MGVVDIDVIFCLWSFLHCSKKRQQWFSVAALRHHMVRLGLARYDCCSQRVFKVFVEVRQDSEVQYWSIVSVLYVPVYASLSTVLQWIVPYC